MAIATSNLSRKETLLNELAATYKNPPDRRSEQSDPNLARLNQLGTQLWLDTGDLEEASRLWRKEMTALTTNNTLANQVVQTGVMDDVIQETVKRVRDLEPGISVDELVMDVVFVVNCHIAMRLVKAFDALVSVELHPAVAHDIERTVRYAERYYAVNPDRFIVKIPLTPEGYCAVARARAEGIPINFTLGFSARQNYLATLLSRPNYVNVFLGRLNQVVAENQVGDGKNVGERTTLASQAEVLHLRNRYDEIPTHQIAASMRNGSQMVSLAGVDVFTIPPKAVGEFFEAHHRPQELEARLKEDYRVALNPGADRSAIEILWTVDDEFRRFAAELHKAGGARITGKEIRKADRDHGTRLFKNFNEHELAEIREKGKIPNTTRWAGHAALDDLMTVSALESFGKDQDAFDDHIRGLISKA